MSELQPECREQRREILDAGAALLQLIEHFERYLGEVEIGWSRDADGDEVPFRVVRFRRGRGKGTISFATLDLGRYPLRSPVGRREIRHELLMIVPDRLRDGPVPGLLQQIGTEVLGAGQSPRRGDVIGPRGELFPGSEMQAMYVAIPVYFPDDFAVCNENGTEVVIAWLVPISLSEARFVRERGWRAFEERLAESDPDLTNVFRASMFAE